MGYLVRLVHALLRESPYGAMRWVTGQGCLVVVLSRNSYSLKIKDPLGYIGLFASLGNYKEEVSYEIFKTGFKSPNNQITCWLN